MATVVLSRSVTGPLPHLTVAAEAVGSGRPDLEVPVCGGDEVGRLTTTFSEMTDRIRDTLAEVEHERERLASIAESLSAGLMMVDRDGTVSYVNESFRRMLQERSEQVVGRSATSVGARWKAVASGSSDAESAGGLFAPGEVSAPLDLQVGSRIIEVSEFRVEDARSRLERGYIFTDETEARQVDRLKNEFVGIASHELRTPLTGILGFASLLAESEELPEAERHWAELIEHESSRLAKIVTDLLNVSRIESGELEAEEAPVPIGELIEGVVGTFRGASAEHQLRVEGPTDQVVRGDRGKLTEVLGNLVDNAIK